MVDTIGGLEMSKLAGLMATAAFLAGSVITGAIAQETIKIGVTQPLTGAFAASGNYVAQGARIAEDEINNAGGVLGKKIQLIIEDNKSNPTETVGTVDECVEQLKEHLAVGVQKLIFVPYRYEMEQIEIIAREIIPRLKNS